MAKLKVFLDGQMSAQYELTSDRDFVAGRGESCDCILRPERGISRQHFRIFQTEMGWEIESLSRYGELYLNNEKVERSILSPGQMFSVPPYEFVFEETDSAEVSVPSISPPEFYGEQSSANTNSGSPGGEERTVIGSMPSSAILRLIDARGQLIQTFSLQGFNWVAGRDIACSIFIDNGKISRKQFEIQKTEETYFVRDLGSQNGTLVNGSPIPNDQWTQMHSSDVISIADWTLVFEIRDANFEQRLSEVDPAYRAPVAFTSGAAMSYQDPLSLPAMYIPLPQNPGAKGPVGGMVLFGKRITWLNPARLAMILIIFFGGMYYLSETNTDEEKLQAAQAQTPFDKLPVEKQQVVKQAYQLARDLYMTGRFELARQKIEEIHAVIPYYEDSQDLMKHVDIAISTQRDRDKLIAQQEEERKRQIKVQEIVERCARAVAAKKDSIVPADLDLCVQPALEFDPTNADIEHLRRQVDQIVQEREIKIAQQAEHAKQVAIRAKLYGKAVELQRRGRSLSAIEAYRTVIHLALPDPADLKSKSRRKIASIEKDLKSRQAGLLRKAESDYAKGNKRDAIKALKKALKINPSNTIIEDRITGMIGELRKEMQPIYHEGILEESVGNVDQARLKFSKILDASVAGEEYYDKANMKMKKYGQ